MGNKKLKQVIKYNINFENKKNSPEANYKYFWKLNLISQLRNECKKLWLGQRGDFLSDFVEFFWIHPFWNACGQNRKISMDSKISAVISFGKELGVWRILENLAQTTVLFRCVLP